MNCKDFEKQYIKNGITSTTKSHLNICENCQITLAKLDKIDNLLSQKITFQLPKQVRKNILNTIPKKPIYSPEIILNIAVGIILFFIVMFNLQSIINIINTIGSSIIQLPSIFSFRMFFMLISGTVGISLLFPIYLKYQDYR